MSRYKIGQDKLSSELRERVNSKKNIGEIVNQLWGHHSSYKATSQTIIKQICRDYNIPTPQEIPGNSTLGKILGARTIRSPEELANYIDHVLQDQKSKYPSKLTEQNQAIGILEQNII